MKVLLLENIHPVAAEAFRRLYTDPVQVNGAAVTVDQLVQRAVALRGALDSVMAGCLSAG